MVAITTEEQLKEEVGKLAAGQQGVMPKIEPVLPTLKPEEIQTKIYSVGKENGYKENLRDWFKLIYEVVFGDENGPRMGFFVSFFGVKETQQLIKDKII